MKKEFSLRNFAVVLCSVIILGSNVVAQQPRNRPAQQNPPVTSLKVRYKTTAAGQSSETTTMVRGPRERSEMRLGYGMDIISLTQCDLKRTVQMSEKTRKYLVTPMDVTATPTSTPSPSSTTAPSTPVTRGGVITYVISSIDTGERKEMFGFTARHVKTTTTMQSSPDACTQVNQKIEMDGWYIDLSVNAQCDFGRAQMARNPVASGGCRDTFRFRQEGTGKTGFPLIETVTMYGPDGRAMFTSSKEVVELSREPLDIALFEVPSDYVETTDAQALYGMPSMTGMTNEPASSRPSTDNRPSETSVSTPKRAGIRVGVVQINNKTDKQVSTEVLRQTLIGQIQSNSIDAVALNALSRTEAEVEAQAKQCDYILFTDITAMKSSKLGGMFGRVTGVSGTGKTEAKLEYKLFAVGGTTPLLQSSASAKEEGDETSASVAISQEARTVTAEISKRGRN